MSQDFFDACIRGDLAAVNLLVESKPEVVLARHRPCRNKRYPYYQHHGDLNGLMLAALYGHTHVVDRLLDLQAISDEDCITLLKVATIRNDQNLYRYLFESEKLSQRLIDACKKEIRYLDYKTYMYGMLYFNRESITSTYQLLKQLHQTGYLHLFNSVFAVTDSDVSRGETYPIVVKANEMLREALREDNLAMVNFILETGALRAHPVLRNMSIKAGIKNAFFQGKQVAYRLVNELEEFDEHMFTLCPHLEAQFREQLKAKLNELKESFRERDMPKDTLVMTLGYIFPQFMLASAQEKLEEDKKSAAPALIYTDLMKPPVEPVEPKSEGSAREFERDDIDRLVPRGKRQHR